MVGAKVGLGLEVVCTPDEDRVAVLVFFGVSGLAQSPGTACNLNPVSDH